MSQYSKVYPVTLNGNKYQIHKEVLEQFDYFEPLMSNKFGDKEINLDFDVDINFDEFVDMMYKAHAMRHHLSTRKITELFGFYGFQNAKELIFVLSIIEYLKPKKCMEMVSKSLSEYMKRNINKEFLGTMTIDDIIESPFANELKKMLITEYIRRDNLFNFWVNVFDADVKNENYDLICESEDINKPSWWTINFHNIDKIFEKYNKKVKTYQFKVWKHNTGSPKNFNWRLLVEMDNNIYKRYFFGSQIDFCPLFAEVISDSFLGNSVIEADYPDNGFMKYY